MKTFTLILVLESESKPLKCILKLGKKCWITAFSTAIIGSMILNKINNFQFLATEAMKAKYFEPEKRNVY